MAEINYKDFNIYSGDSVGNKKFDEIGPVGGSSYEWVWESCEKAVVDAVAEMVDSAKRKGGNVVYNVRFAGKDNRGVKEAACTRSMGWLLILVPLGVGSDVSGIAAKTDEKTTALDSILFGESDNPHVVAERYVAQLYRGE